MVPRRNPDDPDVTGSSAPWQRSTATQANATTPRAGQQPAAGAAHDSVSLVATGRHHRAREHRASVRKIAVILVVFGLITVVGIGGIAALRLSNNLTSSPLNLSDGSGDVDDGPLDILVMGSDTRDGHGNDEYGARTDSEGRTDVMMLVHVTEARDAVTVISFPRDLVVDIPQCTDPQTGERYPAHRDMLNSAVTNGGPGCTVATVNELAGVNIDHFMLADFNAVKELSSTVGGVQVCVNEPVDDPKSGLRLPAGISTVEGEQALAFLRSRAAFGDGGDESRIRSQQSFLASLTRKIQADGTLNNLPQLYHIAEVMTQNLHVDEGLTSLPTLVGIARTFAGIDLSRIAFVTVPTQPNPEDPNRLVLESHAAQRLFDTLREDRAVTDTAASPEATGSASGTPSAAASEAPTHDDAAPTSPGPAASSAAPSASAETHAPSIDPGVVPLSVQNRSGHEGRGRELTRQLRGEGYSQARARASGSALAATQIFYNPSWLTAAEDVAHLLGVPRSQLVASYDVTGVSVSVGQDFASGEKLELSGTLPEDLEGQTAEQFTCQESFSG